MYSMDGYGLTVRARKDEDKPWMPERTWERTRIVLEGSDLGTGLVVALDGDLQLVWYHESLTKKHAALYGAGALLLVKAHEEEYQTWVKEYEETAAH